MSSITTITITDDNGIDVFITPPPPIDVTIQTAPIDVTLSTVGLQGPRGFSQIWVGSTPPDPAQYPLWLDTST